MNNNKPTAVKFPALRRYVRPSMLPEALVGEGLGTQGLKQAFFQVVGGW